MTTIPALAESDDDFGGGIEEMLKYSNTVENAFANQKQITDEEFQKTLNEVKTKQNKKKKINKADKPFKGKEFNEENNGGYINETAEKNILLILPLALINGDGKELPVGHYKVIGEKENGNVYLNFYQAHSLVAKVPAIETNSDFDQTAINFVQLVPYNDERVKVIYGSMDVNAYTFIRIKNKISD